MARILFGTRCGAFQTRAFAPLVRTLVARGHAVEWHADAPYRAAAEAAGATFRVRAPAPEAPGPEPRDPAGVVARALLGDVAQRARELAPAFGDGAPDLVVADPQSLALRWLAERHAVPCALVGTTVFSLDPLPPDAPRWQRAVAALAGRYLARVRLRGATRAADRERAALGLPPLGRPLLDALVSADLFLHGTTSVFEDPGPRAPATLRLVGPFLAERPRPSPAREPGAALRVSLFAGAAGALRAPVAEACRGAGASLRELGEGAGPHEDGEPTSTLDASDVLVAEGDWALVHAALARGVPVLVTGAREECMVIARLVDRCGAGIAVRSDAPGSHRIGAALARLRDEPRFRARAAAIARDFAAHDAPRESAELLEGLLSGAGSRPRPDASRPPS